jgi:insulysin
MDKEMYGQLRTVEQLGYIVSCSQQFRFGVCSLRLLVQSVHLPTFLEVRIETFLTGFAKHLADMSQEDFAEHVDSLITKKKEKDRSAERRCNRFMNEVCSHSYNFSRKHKIAGVLATVTKDDLIAFYDKHVSPASQSRAKFTSHVTGKAALDTQKEAGEEPDVTPESAKQVLMFDKGAVPFPIEGQAADLPEPKVVSIGEYRRSQERYQLQL